MLVRDSICLSNSRRGESATTVPVVSCWIRFECWIGGGCVRLVPLFQGVVPGGPGNVPVSHRVCRTPPPQNLAMDQDRGAVWVWVWCKLFCCWPTESDRHLLYGIYIILRNQWPSGYASPSAAYTPAPICCRSSGTLPANHIYTLFSPSPTSTPTYTKYTYIALLTAG